MANTVSCTAFSSSIPISIKFVSSTIHASSSSSHPLASKIIVKRVLVGAVPLYRKKDYQLRGLSRYIDKKKLRLVERPSSRKKDIDLAFSTSESGLLKEFSKYGQIAEVKLIKDEVRQKSRGFAFIQYTSQEAALLALESMDHQLFGDRRVFVELAKPRRNDFGGYPKTSGPPLKNKDGVEE